MKYNFAGYVTKYGVKCSDGVTIQQGAFKDQDNTRVPLVYQHSHDKIENVIGHAILEHREDGLYGYGYLNDTTMGKTAKELVKHGDITAMSIFANRLRKASTNVVHGVIREVSLVLAGANPGAMIDYVDLRHSDGEATEAIIYSDSLIHSAETIDELNNQSNEEDEGELEHAAKTIGEVYGTMNEEQKNMTLSLIEEVMKEASITHTDDLEGETDLKTNLFNKKEDTLSQSAMEEELRHSVFESMYTDKLSLKEAIAEHQDDFVEHGITNIEKLFDDAHMVGQNPFIYIDQNTASEEILADVRKLPFARLKNLVADFTSDDARALGYKKGDKKIDQVFELYGRETYPQTVYKKQSYDRDDVIDVTEIDLINFTKSEMRMMLNRELARAIIVGDGRASGHANKIKEDKIRPILGDDDFYTIPKEYTDTASIIEAVIKGMTEYRGSGTPKMWMHPNLIADLRLLKANDGRYLFGEIPSVAAMAARLGVSKIVPSTYLPEEEFLICNLNDYSLGANKGGQVTTFDDFDIDFNKLKYLIETRCSGSLMTPKSAVHFKKKI